MSDTAATEATQELTVRSAFNTDELRAIDSFDAAMALVADTHGVVAADEEIGDGFALLDNKDALIDVPLIFMEWAFHAGDFGTFVSARVAAKSGNGLGRYIVNDGSTGICAQLQEFTARTGRMGGLVARHGLRKSTYMTDENGKPTTDKDAAKGTGSTYYIDTSA